MFIFSYYNLDIVCVGQAATHLPQAIHFAWSITGRPSIISIAFVGQIFLQLEHLIQATGQDLAIPASSNLLLQTTATFCTAEIISIKLLGHDLIHLPHPIHL